MQSVIIVALGILAMVSASVIPADEEVQWPAPCNEQSCGGPDSAYICIPMRNPTCLFAQNRPCNPQMPRCIRKPAIQPAQVETRASRCPAASGMGLCAFMCQSDSDCSAGLKCCRNGCGGTNCMTPV